MKNKNISFFIFLSLAAGFFTSCQNTQEKENELVRIEMDNVISSEFIGNGVEWSAYPHADSPDAEWGLLMTEDKWQQVFDRLDYMKPQIVRVLDQANWRYLKGMDDDGNPIVEFDNPEMEALFKLLDYCQENNVKVILGEWGQPYKIHDTNLNMQDAFTGTNDPRWISIIADHVEFLIKEKGYTTIDYYNLVNEPNGYWSTVDGNWEEWKEGILMLDSAFVARGLKEEIEIIGPDATPYNNEASAYTGEEWAREAVLQLSDVLGAYDVHDYPTKDFVRSGEFGAHYGSLVSFADSVARKPFILGEIGFEKYVEENIERYEADEFASPDSQMSIYDFDYGVDMADVLVQSMNSGFDAVIAWGLDDAMHTNGDTGDKTQLKKWGMWNILGKELTGDSAEEDIRPWFYTWSIMTRYFPGEMIIVKNSGLNMQGVRMVVGRTEEEQITFAVVNNSVSDATFQLDTEIYQDQVFRKFIYSEDLRPVDSNNFPVPHEENLTFKDKTSTINIPSKSVVLYTTYKY
ncbi:hypothetical protein OQ279_06800 [Salinimicrobium sp. MT39]|uniref:Glycoside hydrolase family 5 domain-containing protein n=1 Tax=Salinimicrobium profundisediminis TaxID=2994553 RepID=A0A9X3I0T0_9FLAO|nr:hypothetical protein [Salinimicrobium profundisediminis]MCX2837859.1 hypothetical protein [Salinimicrobium profundisediminis]